MLTSGCLGVLDGRPPSDDRAVEVRERALTAVAGTDSYRFDIRGRVTASGDGETRTVRIAGTGVVDAEARRMRVESTTGETTRTSYVHNYTSYTECTEPWDGWGVEDLNADRAWLSYTPLGRQLDILERSRVYWRGDGTVDGDRTLVIVAHPTAETLRQVGDGAAGAAGDVTGLENATLTVHVDPETARPVRSRLRLELERGGASATATLRTDFTAYGDSVETSAPEGLDGQQYSMGCPGAEAGRAAGPGTHSDGPSKTRQ